MIKFIFQYLFFLLGRPGLPGAKGEVGDWFKGINGKFVVNEKTNLSYIFRRYTR